MTSDQAIIQKIEDLSLNAWPSWRIQFYDGWVLRYSAFYTHRTNCVEQIAEPLLPYQEKIEYCEEMYAKWQTPCIFKKTPLTDPVLVEMLIERGYQTEHETNVMTISLDNFSADNILYAEYPLNMWTKEVSASQTSSVTKGPLIHTASLPGADGGAVRVLPLAGTDDITIRIAPRTDTLWLDSFFDLKGNISAAHIRIVPQMYGAVPKDEIAILLFRNGRVIGTGLGILDRDAVGVYAVYIAPEERRKGLAQLIVRTILIHGKERGAAFAYLQAVAGNDSAHSLYEKIGFSDCYTYSFLVRR